MTVEHKLQETIEKPADYLRGLVKSTGFYVHKTEKETIVICTKSYSVSSGQKINDRQWENTILVLIDKATADPEKMMFYFNHANFPDVYDINCELAFEIKHENDQESVVIFTRESGALETQFGNVSVISFDPAYDPDGPNGRPSSFYLSSGSAFIVVENIAETIRKTRLPGLE